MTSWSLNNVDKGRELYLAPSFEKLQEMANVNLTVPSEKATGTLSELERRANLARLDGDHEMAYVYIMRYVAIALDLKKRKVQSVSVDYDNLKRMIALADVLSSSLRTRYDAQASTIAVTAPAPTTDDSPPNENSQLIPPATLENSSTTVSNSQTDENKKPTVSACSKTCAKLQSEEVWLDTKQLYSLMKTCRNSDELLIIDCRPADDFSNGHIDYPATMNVPEDILKPASTCSIIDRELAGDTSSKLFQRRSSSKNIVLVDWDSGESDSYAGRKQSSLPATDSPVWCLYAALTKWNDKPIVAAPKILRKGYNGFLLLYKQHTTSRHQSTQTSMAVKRQNQLDDEFRKPLSQQTDYPDLDEVIGLSSKKTRPAQTHRPAPPIPGPKPVPLQERQQQPQHDSHSSPLSQMQLPSFDRSKKPTTKPPSLPNQLPGPITTATWTPMPAAEPVVVSSKPEVSSTEVNELDSSVKRELEREIEELNARKKEQLKELAEIMRAKRTAATTPAVLDPVEPLLPEPSVSDSKMPTTVAVSDQPDAIPTTTTIASEEVVEPVDQTDASPQLPRETKATATTSRVRARSHSPPVEKKSVDDPPAVISTKPPASTTQEKPLPSVDRTKKPALTTSALPMPQAPKFINGSSNNKTTMPVHESRAIVRFSDNSADPSLLQPVHGTTSSGVSGLRNMGNTCYLNSIVQCLAAAPGFSDNFVYSAYKNAIDTRHKLMVANNVDPATKIRPLVTVEMARTLKAMFSRQFRSLAPTSFKQAVGSRKPDFATFKQQDAQEFLTFLLDTLNDEVNTGFTSVGGNADNDTEPKTAQAAWALYTRNNSSLIVSLFHGQLQSTITCLNCRSRFPTFQEFGCLTLPVPPSRDRDELTIHDCLGAYVFPEFIEGYRCSHCKKAGRVTKKMDIVRCPSLLIIHLNRFAWSDSGAKIKDPVLFQVDNFVLGSRTYSLFGVCHHFGTLEAGHYTATTRPSTSLGRPASTFYRYDDSEVSSLSASQLFTDKENSKSAYLLFYAANDIDWAKYRHSLMSSKL